MSDSKTPRKKNFSNDKPFDYVFKKSEADVVFYAGVERF